MLNYRNLITKILKYLQLFKRFLELDIFISITYFRLKISLILYTTLKSSMD